jgi:hypothetical protein
MASLENGKPTRMARPKRMLPLEKAFGVQRVSGDLHINDICVDRFIILLGQKMYAKQTVYDAHLKSKKHLKAAARTEEDSTTAHPTSGASQASSRLKSKFFQSARLSYITLPLLKDLHGILLETRGNVERRFSLTSR